MNELHVILQIVHSIPTACGVTSKKNVCKASTNNPKLRQWIGWWLRQTRRSVSAHSTFTIEKTLMKQQLCICEIVRNVIQKKSTRQSANNLKKLLILSNILGIIFQLSNKLALITSLTTTWYLDWDNNYNFLRYLTMQIERNLSFSFSPEKLWIR